MSCKIRFLEAICGAAIAHSIGDRGVAPQHFAQLKFKEARAKQISPRGQA